MKVWICEECGREAFGSKPEKCECGALNSFVQMERQEESGFGCKGPGT